MRFTKATLHLFRYWLLALGVAAAAAPAAAQQSANNARGLNAESYKSDLIDDINLYNGNLTLSIPLGETYKVGGALTFQLTLYYNSNAWEIKPAPDRFDPQDTLSEQSVPSPHWNAGMGWRLSLGNLYAPRTAPFNESTDPNDWVYVGPDGAEHRFRNSIRDGVDPDGRLYTRDGTLLRLNPSLRRLEFPDGKVHAFDADGRLTQIKDAWGNRVDVDYLLENNAWVWKLTEVNNRFGGLRQHFVRFNFSGQVESVQLASFGGGNRTRFDFFYTTTTVARHSKDNYHWAQNGLPERATVYLLDRVELPAGAGSYAFEYARDYEEHQPGVYSVPGVIKKATLPTGGGYEWTFSRYTFELGPVPPPGGIADPGYPFRWSSSDGVRDKKIVHGAQVLGAYAYTQNKHIVDAEPHPFIYLTTDVVGPDGNLTVNYFWNRSGHWDYGLPYSRHQSVAGADGQQMYLSQEVYRGAERNEANKLRSTYLRYEADAYPTNVPAGSDTGMSRRVAAERVAYHDDGGRVADVYRTEWNGLGNFKRTTTGGSFGSGDVRIIFTDYMNFAQRPGLSAGWVLNTYTRQDVTEGTTATTEYHFSPSTGALLRKRTRKGVSRQPQDVLVQNTYDPVNGSVLKEEHFGGDEVGGLPTGVDISSASVAPAAAKEYELTHTFTEGAGVIRHTAAYAGQGFHTADEDVDKNTGLTKETRDPAGVSTVYAYDDLGRPTHTQTHTDALTVVDYLVTEMRVHRFNPGNEAIAFSYVRVDPFGRASEEAELLHGGVWSRRRTTYDAMGRTLSVSEFGNFTKRTQYARHDPFGRPGRVIAPDGTATDFDYTGVSRVRRTRRVGTSQAGGVVSRASLSSYEFYDRQGRLVGVQEDSGPGDTPRATNYQYDVGGRLKQVAINYGGGGERANVAWSGAGATAVSSSCIDESRWPTMSVIDNNISGAGWGQGFGGWNDATNGAFPDWVEVRFNGAKTIDEISVITLQDNFSAPDLTDPSPEQTTFSLYGITHFDVQYWDGAAWRGVGGRAGNNKVWSRFTFAPVTTTKIRVLVGGAPTSGGHYSRIVEVQAFGTAPAPAGGRQFRTFTYDNRGFLAAEKHPEQNVVPSFGDTALYKYDSMGRVTEKQDARSHLQFAYDSAGRMTALHEWAGAWRPLKTFAYYGANVAGFDNAKLRHAVRYNYVFNPFDPAQSPASGTEMPIQIKESYEYAGRAGRVSKRETFFNAANPAPYHFVQHFSYDLLGNLETQTYPYCVNATCVESGAQNQRTVHYSRPLGRLKQVGVAGNPGLYASDITYHVNRALASVAHGNGVTDGHEMDPNHMGRPRRISTSNGLFDTGHYEYDGAGNVVKVGPDWFLYDGANRVKEATAQRAARKRQTFSYDPQGNLLYLQTFTNLGDASPWEDMQLSVNPATNRLDGLLYDGGGNILGVDSQVYHYDALNRQKYAPNKIYLYGPSDERMWVVDYASRTDIVDVAMLRGLGNELLREYQVRKPPQSPWLPPSEHGDRAGNWTWQKDYVYRDGQLLAAETAQWGRLDYHVDHLGSPRLVTNASGQAAEPVKHYFPFGREASETAAVEARLNFTGHERDRNYVPGHLLDYMHARHYTPHHGRFLSVDPKGRYAPLRSPQLYNRYSYVGNNPLGHVDPDGRDGIRINDTGKDADWLRSQLVQLIRRPDGRAMLQKLAETPGYTHYFSVNRIAGNEEKIKAFMNGPRGAEVKIDGGQTFYKNTSRTEGQTFIDRQSISELNRALAFKGAIEKSKDPFVTLGHEVRHAAEGTALGLPKATIEAMHHTPTNDTGLAEQFGIMVAKQKPDMISEATAKAALQHWEAGQKYQF